MVFNSFPFLFSLISNTTTFLKVMEGKSILPSNLNDIPKFKSDTSKWVYFFANLTEEVWIPLKEVFEADYKRRLKFQLIHDGLDTSEETKVHMLYIFFPTFGFVFNQFLFKPIRLMLPQTQHLQMIWKFKPNLSCGQLDKIWMALSSPTCSIYILLSKFLFFDVSLTSILLKRNLQMIFPSISAWVWVVLFLFFSHSLVLIYMSPFFGSNFSHRF